MNGSLTLNKTYVNTGWAREWIGCQGKAAGVSLDLVTEFLNIAMMWRQHLSQVCRNNIKLGMVKTEFLACISTREYCSLDSEFKILAT